MKKEKPYPSINAQKALGKIQHQFIGKTNHIRRYLPQSDKGYFVRLYFPILLPIHMLFSRVIDTHPKR